MPSADAKAQTEFLRWLVLVSMLSLLLGLTFGRAIDHNLDHYSGQTYYCAEDMACFEFPELNGTPEGQLHIDSPYYPHN